jgi:hypothetical protein
VDWDDFVRPINKLQASVKNDSTKNRTEIEMTENIKNITSELIEKYILIIEQNGDPNEAYKYLAINTFQQNWNLDAGFFQQSVKSTVPKLLGFYRKISSKFPRRDKRNVSRFV